MPTSRRTGRSLLALPLLTLPLVAGAVGPAGALASAQDAPGRTRPGAVAGAAAGALAGASLGHDRIGVRRADTWYLRDALDGGPSRGYREDVAGWAPIAGDFDGDGNGSVSLFAAGVFRLRDVERGPARIVRFGGPGDHAVVGDWDGDGVDTVGVFRAGRWFLRASNSSTPVASRAFSYGRAGDVPVVGDWDGNGRDDIGVRRGNAWFQRDAANAGPSSRTFTFGVPTDLPVAGDWDHDGRDTPGLYRAGTWFLRRGSFPSPHQTVRFGGPGDRPVVRRTRGLAPGVTHSVLSDAAAPWVAHVTSVALAAASTPDPVLSQDRLRGTEPLSTMTRRSGAVVGVNGDFFLPSGRPVHLHAADGRLVQTPTSLGRAFSLDASGTRFSMGYPTVRASVIARPGQPTRSAAGLPRVNHGPPTGGALSAYTAEGHLLESPPDGQCYTLLTPAGGGLVRPDGSIDTPARAAAPRCGGPRPQLPPSGTLLAAEPAGPAGGFLRGLAAGTPVTLKTQLGFPGAVDALGGNPLLVVDGAVVASEVDNPAEFYGPHPRTAVGVTADGRLLLVVVEGRQPGYSRGMTMREVAELLQRLGAVSALNLDGGGSSEMVVNGVVATRPSDGSERPIANALVVLPGPDRGQAGLRTDVLPAGDPLSSALRGPSGSDAASTGGLADALLRSGVPVSAELRRSAEHLRSVRAGQGPSS